VQIRGLEKLNSGMTAAFPIRLAKRVADNHMAVQHASSASSEQLISATPLTALGAALVDMSSVGACSVAT
jgi:hypothetical protein